MPEENKDDELLLKMINRGSLLKQGTNDTKNKNFKALDYAINGKIILKYLLICTMIVFLLFYPEESSSSSLSDVSSNSNMDQGSVTEKSHKLSSSSQKASNERSWIASSEKSKKLENKASSILSNNESNISIPNFGGNDTASKTVSIDRGTSKSMPPIKEKDSKNSMRKFDSILDISSRIIEEEESDKGN